MRIADLSVHTPLVALASLALVAGCGGAAATGDVTPAAQPDPAPAATPAPAQPAAETPAAGGASLADGVYTDAQAERGYLVWRDTCAECHGENEMYGTAFMFEWEGSSVGRLYRLISRQMPDDDPGSLPTESYVDVLTYILQLNEFPAGTSELTADEERLDALTIEN